MEEKVNFNTQKTIVMYVTARQFKNAILEEEMIVIPNYFNVEEGSVLEWGSTKMTVKGNKCISKVFPFVVNKAFACEVYLKLLLIESNYDLKKLKRGEKHNIFKLYEKNNSNLKEYIENEFLIFGESANKEYVEKEIKDISNVFIQWRYIYEKLNEENVVNYGFLNMFCELLDKYSQEVIMKNYNYDVTKDMR